MSGRADGRGSGEDSEKARLLAALAGLFEDLGGRAGFRRAYPEYSALAGELRRQIEAGVDGEIEDVILRLYCYLHGAGSAYEPGERRTLDAMGGYWCHAGGLSPLWRAAPFVGPGSVVADYGAGNGFQGLLLQHLYPHRRTVQIELSGPMIERGRRLQEFMGIPGERVEWLHRNVVDVPPTDFDFIYIYRPLRPEGAEGRRFYERFSRDLAGARHTVTVFSIADCLKDFLGEEFRPFYDDGHLTCFTNSPALL